MDERLLSRSQRMLSRVGAKVPKIPDCEGKSKKLPTISENDYDTDDVVSNAGSSLSLFSPSEAVLLGISAADTVELSDPSKTKATETPIPSTNAKCVEWLEKQRLLKASGEPVKIVTSPSSKPFFVASASRLVEYSPSTETSNATKTTDQTSGAISNRDSKLRPTGFNIPVRKKLILDNLILVDDDEKVKPSAVKENGKLEPLRVVKNCAPAVVVSPVRTSLSGKENSAPVSICPTAASSQSAKAKKVVQEGDPAAPTCSVPSSSSERPVKESVVFKNFASNKPTNTRTATSKLPKKQTVNSAPQDFATEHTTPSKNREAIDRTAKTHGAPTQNGDSSSEDGDDWGEDDDDPSWSPEQRPASESYDITDLEDNNSDHDSSGNRAGALNGSEEEQEATAGNAPKKKTKKSIRMETQVKRNHGQEYKTKKGKTVPARRRKKVHQCSARKCHLVVTPENADAIFKEYWEQGCYEGRVKYICSRIECNPIERSRKRSYNTDKKKEVSYQYFFQIDGKRHQVCKSTFLGTLDETDTFLRNCARKMRETTSGIGPKERRGSVTPKHAHSNDMKEKIRAHISSFPAYVSHYCRMQTKQKYLSSTLSVSTMLNKFNEENEGSTVSYSAYYRIFKTMNLKFKAPASDTCATCDEFQAKIKFAKSEEDKNALTKQHELHLRRAEAAYNLKRQYKKLAKEDSTVKCLIFDLEQVLPTPNVSCGKAYYLRQLSTYNLTIVDTATNITYNYMWHEGVAARGACEIASCLFTHIMDEVPEGVRHLYLFSDCCSGQNRNSIVAAMLQVSLQTHCSLSRIDHIFLVPGHTRMECDSKHSRIEHQKSKSGLISVPSHWYDMVRSLGPSFKVIEMENQFINFPALLEKNGPLIMRDKLENGDKMYWSKTHWFKYNSSSPGIIMVRPSFAVESEMSTYNMIRGIGKNRKLPSNWYSSLGNLQPGHVISQAKKDNLSYYHTYQKITMHFTMP